MWRSPITLGQDNERIYTDLLGYSAEAYAEAARGGAGRRAV
ncbi:MAG: hypothetical protein U0531_09745 [Dehalococcoidia bacterium]